MLGSIPTSSAREKEEQTNAEPPRGKVCAALKALGRYRSSSHYMYTRSAEKVSNIESLEYAAFYDGGVGVGRRELLGIAFREEKWSFAVEMHYIQYLASVYKHQYKQRSSRRYIPLLSPAHPLSSARFTFIF
jgi:predicted ATPase